MAFCFTKELQYELVKKLPKIVFPDIHHSFKVHCSSSQHYIDIIPFYSLVKVSAYESVSLSPD